MSLSESNQKSQNSTKKQSVWKTTLLRHYSDFFDYRPVDRTKNFGNYNFRQSTNKLVEKSEKIKIDVCDNIDLTKDESVEDDKSTKKTPFKKPIRAKKILKKATKSADSEKAFLVNKSITIKRIPGHEHKAPQKYRQRFAEKLFSVCSTMFQDKNADVLNVVKQVEKSIASKSNSPNAYKQFCISTLVELKRRKSIEWLIKSVSEKSEKIAKDKSELNSNKNVELIDFDKAKKYLMTEEQMIKNGYPQKFMLDLETDWTQFPCTQKKTIFAIKCISKNSEKRLLLCDVNLLLDIEFCFSDKNDLSLKKVQNKLLNIVSNESILIGNGLQEDLKMLKMYHKNVIDISLLKNFEKTKDISVKKMIENFAKMLKN